MGEESLAARFEEHRAHLHAVAYRVLGSNAEADDAVQEAWLRVSRAGDDGVANLGGWLTTIVGRVALNMLRARTTRREVPWDEPGAAGEHDAPAGPGSPAADAPGDPADAAVLSDSVGIALLVVLETLSPAERLAFVLHDMFAVPFDEIAPIIDRTPAAARQLASRARRRVRGGRADATAAREREVVTAFLAASREGDFAALLTLLDTGAVLRADSAAAEMGGPVRIEGREALAAFWSGRAKAVLPVLVDGVAGGMWQLQGVPQVVFDFTVRDGRVVAIDLVADPAVLASVELSKPPRH
ncbi:sigma-70 family RNA polymerase sigma factor [Actinomadura harenae]|uniref:Sigma-70 family RNA polymerase sigma factor n=1 Tax=Actinomadura harenae TaxID=2483351 RepID=A0A3M2LFZ3_9ACTN|nr:sigma-70 family RNA polymerase sigma factor [Actinomadura harenae]RMI35986.1 sigma-70 family RNA polymerase sigma factor [Actinomadura harenae]